MASTNDAHAHDGDRFDTRHALQLLAAALTDAVGGVTDPSTVDGAVDAAVRRHGPAAAESWPHLLDDLARSLGLRVSWRIGTAEAVREEVDRVLPAVTWTVDGWRILSNQRGRVEVTQVPGSERRLPFERAALPDDTRTWGLVEDALPGSLFGGEQTRAPMQRLVGLLQAERSDLKLVFGYALTAGLLGLAVPVAVQILVNTVAFGTLMQPIIVIALILFLCLALAAALRGLQRYVVEMLQRRVFVRMTADLAERLPRVRLDAWDRKHGPELVNRFFDVLTVQKSMSSLLLDGLSASMQALVGMVLLALYHPALLGFDVFLVGAIVALVYGLGRGGQDTAVVESKKKYVVAGWLEEIAAHPILYKLGGGSDLAVRRADVLARSWLDARDAHFRVFFRQYGGALALQVVANTALLLVGGWLVLERQLTIGQLVAAEFIVATVLSGFAKFSEKLETFYDLLAAVDKLGQLVDLPLERNDGWRASLPEGPVGLRVDGLVGRRPDGRVMFDDLSVTAAPGEMVSVLGADGTGKSTLADVLLGLREPDGGRIVIDTVDLREMRLDTLRRRVALVRSAEMVSGTIADNLTLGRHAVGPDQIRDALARVGLEERVDRLPEGIDTEITASGAPFTDGERARLAVARALAAGPRLVVVDGLLDEIESGCRERVVRALTVDRTWTLLVLTRDPDIAGRFQRVLQFKDGRIVPASLPPKLL